MEFHQTPFESGNLNRKTCELIYIALDASVNHLYSGGIEMHIVKALEEDATVYEILDTIQLSMLTVHATQCIDAPILIQEMERVGITPKELGNDLSDQDQATKNRYIETTGHWPKGADELLELSNRFAKAMLNYGEVPYESDALAPRI
ncbi:hypothetical protein G3T16_16825 [Kineobactrum salinum]|uniref:Uncharacterized protein n=1 Tax=Kineobactrum salinum TaxID=2708301 RepID=A0A6C0U4F2_9GAMM|nr:hypothetical protein G3T16_16825 [Kineobactrum salinum]